MPRVVFGVAGSIAAYRAPDIVKALVAKKYELQCILTSSGAQFTTSKVLETFSSRKVLSNDVWASENLGTDHIEYARWADVFVVYGATANLLAKLAHGFCDDFLTLQIAATKAPVVLLPAMNVEMWNNPITQKNVQVLKACGYHFVGPVEGTLACGEKGMGHIAPLEDLEAALEKVLHSQNQKSYFSLKNVLISLGSMQTDIDDVRFVQNKSSGKMGLELARVLRGHGAHVELLVGCVSADVERQLEGFNVSRFTTYCEYRDLLNSLWKTKNYSVFFSVAAVLDFTLTKKDGKFERGSDKLMLELNPTEDLVAWAVSNKKSSNQKVVAFALESAKDQQSFLKRAHSKLVKKGADLIVANRADQIGAGPNIDTNACFVLNSKGLVAELSMDTKENIAIRLLDILSTHFDCKGPLDLTECLP